MTALTKGSSATNLASFQKRHPIPTNREKAISYAYDIILRAEITSLDDTDPIDLSNFVYGMAIEKPFSSLYMPAVRLILKAPKPITSALQEDFRTIKINFTLKRFEIVNPAAKRYINPVNLIDTKELSIISIVGENFSDDSIPYELDSSPSKLDLAQSTLEIHLFETSALKSKRPLLNQVYSNTTVGAVIDLLSKQNFSDKSLVIEKPDNEKIYEDIFIPPLSFPDTLEYLQAFYGVYKTGIQVFVDFDNVFITSCVPNLEIPEKISNINLRVISREQQSPAAFISPGTSFIDDENKILEMFLSSRPVIDTGDTISKESIGGNIYIGQKDGITSTIGGGGINPSEDDKEMYIWSKSSSEFAADEIAFRINRKTESATCSVTGVDIAYLDPIAKVKLLYEYELNRAMHADYRISAVHHVFNKLEDDAKAFANADAIFAQSSRLRLSRI